MIKMLGKLFENRNIVTKQETPIFQRQKRLFFL